MKPIDITGQKFGKLTAVELMPSDGKSSRKWRCICDCGEETFARGTALRFGSVTSCGCRLKDGWTTRRVDLTGKQFGLLTVIAKQGKTKFGKLTWLCRCECGNEKVIRGADLVRENTKSCGCRQSKGFGRTIEEALYVVCFASGHAKFGRSENARSRVICYAREACIAGGATAHVAKASGSKAAEKRLLEEADKKFKHAIGELYAEVPEHEALELLKKHANSNDVISIRL